MAKKPERNRAPRAPGPEGSGDSASPPPEAAPKPANRLSITLTEDESGIAWDRMQGKTKEKLKELLTNPETAAALGVDTAAAGASARTSDGPVDTNAVGMLLGAVGAVLVVGAQMAGYSQDEALKLAFTERERDGLAEPTHKVLAKYSRGLGRWEDEIMLAVLLGSVIGPKIATLKKPGKVINMVPRAEAAPGPVAAAPAAPAGEDRVHTLEDIDLT